jgi:hypothetical protein
LFLFINDLPQAVQEAKVALFADDAYITQWKRLTSLKRKIVKVMKQLENWFLTHNFIIWKRLKQYYFKKEDPSNP